MVNALRRFGWLVPRAWLWERLREAESKVEQLTDALVDEGWKVEWSDDGTVDVSLCMERDQPTYPKGFHA